MEKELFAPIYILICHIVPYICAKTHSWWNDDDDNTAAIAVLIFGLAGVIAALVIYGVAKMFEVIGNCANNAKAKLKAKLYGQPIGWDGHQKVVVEESLSRIKAKAFDLTAINYMKQLEDNQNTASQQNHKRMRSGFTHFMHHHHFPDSHDRRDDLRLTMLKYDIKIMKWMIETNSVPVYKHKCFRQQPLTTDMQIHNIVHTYDMLQTLYSPATALLKLVNNDGGLEIEIKSEPLPELEVTF